MRPLPLLAFALLATIAATPAAAQREAQNRCGWLSNPTPANVWLRDRQGEWLISSQGGYHARGMDALPDLTIRGWVRTNGDYGYGCACINATVDRRNHRVERLYSAESRPISQCRRDHALPRRP